LRHDGNRINSSYIYNNTGFTTATSIKDATLVWTDAAGLVSNVTLDAAKEHLVFEVPAAAIINGNAVVAVRDLNYNIMWSWHIWVTGANPTETIDVTNYQGKTYSFMRQNLGTIGDGTPRVAPRRVTVRLTQQIAGGQSRQFLITSDGLDPYFHSTFYQFGRKDPLPGLKDGYTIHNNNSGRVEVASSHGTIPLAIRNPHVFYIGTGTSQYDWNYNTPSTEGMGYAYKQSVDNLWDIDNNVRTKNDNTVHKTVYDPSPVGFKMPPGNVFTGFTTTGAQSRTLSEWNVVDSTSAAYDSDGGWKFLVNGADSASWFFPATGYLRYDNANISGLTAGYYWSAAPMNNGYGYYLQFNSGEVNPSGGGGRSMGVPVRPVSE
jgi:hypothetical protein